jgi:hypothetical protein
MAPPRTFFYKNTFPAHFWYSNVYLEAGGVSVFTEQQVIQLPNPTMEPIATD